MKSIIISISICFCFLQAIGQNKVNKTTISKEAVTSINELIQGKWQSLDDKTNFLVFDKNERKEIGAGMKTWTTEPFGISNKCLNEGNKDNGIDPEKDKYISCKKSDMCWYIVAISKDFLTLSYMGRGNTLKYKRAK